MDVNEFYCFDQKEIRELEKECKSRLGILSKTSRIIKGEIFKILSDNSLLIQYPIEDDELCGFVCRKNDKVFSFINSFLPLEKQIFAAAHELYHIWYDEDILDNGEVLKRNVIDPQDMKVLTKREAKANRFAAMFLAPREILQLELMNLEVSLPNKLGINHIVQLMDIFAVPYKAIVRRLYEIDFIDHNRCQELLSLPDRDEMSGVRLLQKRMKLGEQWQQRTRITKFANLVDSALTAFEQNQISIEKLTYLLAMAKTNPENFGIENVTKTPSEEDLLKILENTEE